MITRRHIGTALALSGILFAILVVHTMDATEAPPPPRPPAPEAEAEAPQETSAPAAVAHVTLPPPPPLAQPKTIAPLPAAAEPASVPRAVSPLKPTPRNIPKKAAEKPVTPLTPEAVRETIDDQTRRITPLTPSQRPEPIAQRKPAPERQPKAKKAPSEVKSDQTSKPAGTRATDAVPDEALRRAGRPLLRLLEHGDGPVVEIAWPGNSARRSQLHRLFAQCYGMRIALLDDRGRLFDGQSAPGMPWAINTDRFSGFIRQSSGGVPSEERRAVRQIRERHGLDRSAAAVRIFPRRADALLLGGLSRLVPDYRKAKRIRARYQLADNRVRIDTIHVDGAPIAGAIDLTRAAAAAASCEGVGTMTRIVTTAFAVACSAALSLFAAPPVAAAGTEALVSFHGADNASWERRVAVQDLLRDHYGFDRVRVLVDATAEEVPKQVRRFLEKPRKAGDRRFVWVSGLKNGEGKTICPGPKAPPIRPAAISLVIAPDCYKQVMRFPQGARHYGMTVPAVRDAAARVGRFDDTDPAFIGFINLPVGADRYVLGADNLIFENLKARRNSGVLDPNRLLAALRVGFRLSGSAYTPTMDLFYRGAEADALGPFGFMRGKVKGVTLRSLSTVGHRPGGLRVHDRPTGFAPALRVRKPGPIRVLRSDRSGAMRYVAIGNNLFGWVRRHDLAM